MRHSRDRHTDMVSSWIRLTSNERVSHHTTQFTGFRTPRQSGISSILFVTCNCGGAKSSMAMGNHSMLVLIIVPYLAERVRGRERGRNTEKKEKRRGEESKEMK